MNRQLSSLHGQTVANPNISSVPTAQWPTLYKQQLFDFLGFPQRSCSRTRRRYSLHRAIVVLVDSQSWSFSNMSNGHIVCHVLLRMCSYTQMGRGRYMTPYMCRHYWKHRWWGILCSVGMRSLLSIVSLFGGRHDSLNVQVFPALHDAVFSPQNIY